MGCWWRGERSKYEVVMCKSMHYAMQTYDAMEAYGHTVLTASLGRSQLSHPKPGYFTHMHIVEWHIFQFEKLWQIYPVGS